MKDDPEFNITFVSLVRQFPCLYDNTSLDYSSKALQLKAWETIASQVNETVRDCKDRWKNLRGCFTRHLKYKANESSGLHRKPYYLANHLNFLLPFTKSVAYVYGDHGDNSQNGDDSTMQDEEDDDKKEVPDGTKSESEKGDEVEDAKHFANSLHKLIIKREPSEDEFVWTSHKRARTEQGTEGEDSDLQFLKSLLPDVREMTGSQKRRFKIGVIQLCEDILNEVAVFQT